MATRSSSQASPRTSSRPCCRKARRTTRCAISPTSRSSAAAGGARGARAAAREGPARADRSANPDIACRTAHRETARKATWSPSCSSSARGHRHPARPWQGRFRRHDRSDRGHIPVVSTTLTTAAPQIRAGRARGLAISAASRLAEFPDIPTYAELGYPDLVCDGWFSLWTGKSARRHRRAAERTGESGA